MTNQGVSIQLPPGGQFSLAVDMADQAAGVGSVWNSFPQPLVVSGACVAAMIDHRSTWFA
jgi:hypothetical protein